MGEPALVNGKHGAESDGDEFSDTFDRTQIPHQVNGEQSELLQLIKSIGNPKENGTVPKLASCSTPKVVTGLKGLKVELNGPVSTIKCNGNPRSEELTKVDAEIEEMVKQMKQSINSIQLKVNSIESRLKTYERSNTTRLFGYNLPVSQSTLILLLAYPVLINVILNRLRQKSN